MHSAQDLSALMVSIKRAGYVKIPYYKLQLFLLLLR